MTWEYSREEQDEMKDELRDREERWRNETCSTCGLARKIVVHLDSALDEFHHFTSGEEQGNG